MPGVTCAARGVWSFEEADAPLSVHANTGAPTSAQPHSRTREHRARLARRVRAAVRLYVLPLCACLTLAACAASPVEETVTVDASRLSPQPAPAVAVTPQLPARDEDIEAAGDHIAAAITSLGKRRGATPTRPNAAAAQRALEQAEAALTRALRDKPHDEPVRAALRAAIHELNTAQRTIQRNAYTDAVRDLTALDKKLDTLPAPQDETVASKQ